jgi:hypothetical protein
MSTFVMTYVGRLVESKCWCGIHHAIPEDLYAVQQRHFQNGQPELPVYCPLGHAYVPVGRSEVDKLREAVAIKDKAIAAERAKHDQTQAELRETERRRRAEKGAKTRLKNRVANGVCPCCQRSFGNLRRHMQHMHPDFTQAEASE